MLLLLVVNYEPEEIVLCERPAIPWGEWRRRPWASLLLALVLMTKLLESLQQGRAEKR